MRVYLGNIERLSVFLGGALYHFLGHPFESTRDTRSIDYQNSFHAVAEFGTSDAPSDFIDSEKRSYMDENDRENDDTSRIDNIVGKSVTNNTNNS